MDWTHDVDSARSDWIAEKADTTASAAHCEMVDSFVDFRAGESGFVAVEAAVRHEAAALHCLWDAVSLTLAMDC
jgi:hypothetical protein